MKNNYSVYQHVTPDGFFYFGATQNVEKRWEGNGCHYKTTALQPYIEKFGWDNIKHIVLFENQSKENALFIENFLIETAREDGVCINKNRSGLVSKEEDYYRDYDQKRSEKRRGYQREYREQNKDKKREYNRQRYQKNRDEILEQNRQYQEQNKDKIRKYQREYQRQYRQRKKLEQQLKEVETTLF